MAYSSKIIRGQIYTLFRKANDLAKLEGVKAIVIIYYYRHFITFRSVEKDSFPPIMKDIVRYISLAT